jgi:MinD superfamily P-loop ATPase
VRHADALVLVTEPTPFGLHDLELSVRLGRDLGIPMGIVVNRDVSGDRALDDFCEQWDVPIIARLPFSRRVAEVYARGRLVAEELPDVAETIASVPDAMREIAAREAAPR